MKRRRHAMLDEEERILWHAIARTVVPLKGKVLEAARTPDDVASGREDGSRDERAGPKGTPKTLPAVSAPQKSPRTTPGKPVLDRPTRTKIARGRLAIDASIDLHGLTQAEAHDLLLAFLRRAAASGKRHVLVVTGKGSTARGEGVLRRVVPGWLATASFNGLVSGYDEAARHHGGSGALYIRLRRTAMP